MASKKRAGRDRWSPPDLKGQVAVVTGASRGAGRAIAEVLGEAGVTVYVTGRSVRGAPTTDGVPGTIEETAEQVTARGGAGVPVRCDHTRDDEVQAAFERAQKEQRRLDLLVNNAWGGYEAPGLVPASFWKAPRGLWDKMFVAGLRAHLVASYFAIPLMLPHRRGLIVSTVAWDRDQYLGSFYDIAKHATVRMIFGLARELLRYNIAAVAVAPGFMRTERVLKAYQTDEQHWRKIAALAKSESPTYTGRAIARLAADPRRLDKSGRAFRAGDLAREYGITDVDGRRVPPFTVRLPFEKLLEEFEKKGPGRRSRA